MSRGMKHRYGSGLSSTLKSRKVEAYKRLRRKGWSESEARHVLQLSGQIHGQAFKPRHRSGNVDGVIAATFKANKRELILAGEY